MGDEKKSQAETDPLGFYRDHVTAAIERRRLYSLAKKPPFNEFIERTHQTAKSDDITEVLQIITTPDEARLFALGYAMDMEQSHGVPHEDAALWARENLLVFATRMYIGADQRWADMWMEALRPESAS